MSKENEEMIENETREWIEASRLYAAENECRFVRIQDAANRSAEKQKME